jgi:hypothetical protein
MPLKSKRVFALGLLLFAFGSTFSSRLNAGGGPPPETEIKSTKDLKQFMYKFGALVAGIEILKVKEKNLDWGTIDLTLKEMEQNLEALQKADTSNFYKQYTDQLAAQLTDLKVMSRRKDKNIYDGFDKLTNTCFQCHAVHRPSDFLKPKENRRISGSD